MPRLPIDQVVEGMMLESPVLDAMGRVLLKKGETLTQRYINKLAIWDVDRVDVAGATTVDTCEPDAAGSDLDESGGQDPGLALSLDKDLDLRFRRAGNGRVMKEIRALTRKHLLARIHAKLANQ